MNKGATINKRMSRLKATATATTIVLGALVGVVLLIAVGGALTRPEQPTTPAAPAPYGSLGGDATPGTLPARVVLRAPAIAQLPELPNGCEVTSLSMLLAVSGHPVDKVTLARAQPIDPTPVVYQLGGADSFDRTSRWGDPDVGFVGNSAGRPGYGIYHAPLARLLNSVLPGHALDLTGRDFAAVLARVAGGTPVVVWTTTMFAPTDDWTTWQSPTGLVHATQDEHAVLLVGYDKAAVYVNDPLDGVAAKPVDRARFLASWQQMGGQAITLSATAGP
jgi:uncharacterized protein YvpB